MSLADQIEILLGMPSDAARQEGMSVVREFRAGLSRGEFRAAELAVYTD
jgi:hypothetical protein